VLTRRIEEMGLEVGDAKSSLGDAMSSLGDAKSSLGDTKSSLGDANIAGDTFRWRTTRGTWTRGALGR
jgi:hypothetical protein